MHEPTALGLADEAARRADERHRLDRKEQRAVRLVVALLIILSLFASAITAVAVMSIMNEHRLNDQVATLTREWEIANRRIGALADQVVSLQDQITQLGGRPVVVERPIEASPPTPQRTTGTTRPSTTTPASTPETTTTTQPPPTTTTTTPNQKHCVLVVCR